MHAQERLITLSLTLAAMLAAAFFSHRLTALGKRAATKLALALLLVAEGYKHLHALSIGAWSVDLLPFHYSTTFLLSLALSLYPRAAQLGKCTLYVGGAFLLLALVYDPHAVVGDATLALQSFDAFHSLFYHVAVLALWAAMLAGNHYHPRRGDTWRFLCFLLGWGAMALPAALLLENNYAGLLRSYIPPLEAVRLHLGQGCYLACYALLAALLAHLLQRLLALAQRRRLTRPPKSCIIK